MRQQENYKVFSNSDRNARPCSHSPKFESELIWPKEPASNNFAPQASAKNFVRSNAMNGSFSLPTMQAGTGIFSTGIGAKFLMMSTVSASAGATRKTPLIFAGRLSCCCAHRSQRTVVTTPKLCDTRIVSSCSCRTAASSVSIQSSFCGLSQQC